MQTTKFECTNYSLNQIYIINVREVFVSHANLSFKASDIHALQYGIECHCLLHRPFVTPLCPRYTIEVAYLPVLHVHILH